MRSIVFILFSLLLIGYQGASSQLKPKLNTNGKGAIFAQVSYNSSIYSKSNVSFVSNTYDFTLNNTMVRDNIEGNGLNSFFSSSSPQFGVKIGYYVAVKWAIVASFDRYNTFLVDQQNVGLNGTFAPGTNSKYSGPYDEEITLDRNDFNLAQRNGINYFAIGVQRADQLFKSRSAAFSFQTVYGLKIGGLFTKVDFTYDDYTTRGISSFSGFGLSANLGLKFDFWQHVFLQLGVDGGLLNQGKIKTSNTQGETAKQVVGFFSPNVSLGFSIFTGSNNCGTCPKW